MPHDPRERDRTPIDPLQRLDRRSVRLPAFDYARRGAYFITICTHDRLCLFSDARCPELTLTPVGRLVTDCWLAIPAHHPHSTLDAFVVMPDHLHGVIVLDRDCAAAESIADAGQSKRRAMRFGRPDTGSIPTIVRSFKAAATRAAREATGQPELIVWQRGYHDRVVRDEEELEKVRRYIAENPERWRRRFQIANVENHPAR